MKEEINTIIREIRLCMDMFMVIELQTRVHVIKRNKEGHSTTTKKVSIQLVSCVTAVKGGYGRELRN